jgi:hypothetical protein
LLKYLTLVLSREYFELRIGLRHGILHMVLRLVYLGMFLYRPSCLEKGLGESDGGSYHDLLLVYWNVLNALRYAGRA